jgi:hypothetical protein
LPEPCEAYLTGHARLVDGGVCPAVPGLCNDIAPCEWRTSVWQYCNYYHSGTCAYYHYSTSTRFHREYVQPEYASCHLLWNQALAFCNDLPIPANETTADAMQVLRPTKLVLLGLAVGFAAQILAR